MQLRLTQALSSLWRKVLSLAEDADFLVCLFLLAAAWGSLNYMKGESAATLAGALFGAFAVLVGNWINRRNELRRRNEALAEQIRNIKTLIAAELVNVASGLIGAESSLVNHVEAFQAGASGGPRDMTDMSPRPMPRTANLSGELLLLEERDIDVLTTLESSLALTKLSMDEVTSGQRTLSLLTAQQLLASVRFNMHILAQAFDRFAPDRKLKLGDSEPELATGMLGRLSQQQQDD